MVNKMKKQKSYEKIKIGFILLLMLLASSNLSVLSQTKNVGIGTDNPNASALLDLDVSNNTEFPTKKGLLIPRVTEAQKNAISDPANGLIIYQTDGTFGFYYYDGSSWVKLTTATEANQYLPLAGGSMTGAINMQNNIIENIGNAGTDFTASGGLNLADAVSATRFTSTVATGTSPFTIASNTLVTNLNADLLDGNHASAFANSTHSHTGVYEPVITAGTSSQYWRGDKTWVNFPTSLAPSGAASGDLSGTYPSPSVVKIQGSSVSATAPTNNQILKWNGTAWTPLADENTTYSAGTGLSLSVGNQFSANNTTALWNANQLQGKSISSTAPTASQLLQFNGTEWVPATIASGGTVTSVGLTMPTQFSVSNSPVTGSGNITVALANQNANTIFAAPDGSTGVPTFRALLASDIPNLSTDKLTTGTLPVARGGTGGSSFNGILKGNLSAPMTTLSAVERQITFWSANNEISGTDSLKWAAGTFSITGDLTVSGEIDPISLTLIPQTTAPTAAEGKIYYNQDDHGLKVYNGTSWVTLGSGGGGAELPAGSENQTLRHNGTDWEASDVLMNNGTKIGIGTNNPDSTLQVVGTAYFTSNTRIGENLLVDGSLSYTPLTATSSPVNTAGKTYIQLNLSGNFELSNGSTVGQVIILQKISNGSANLQNTNCKLSGDWDGTNDDTIQLIWDGSFWVEIGRSLN